MSAVTVGGWTDAFCSSCKRVGEHVVVAMVGTRPARVECTSCKKQHAYRAMAPADAKAAKAEKLAKAADAKPKPGALKRAATLRSKQRAAAAAAVPLADRLVGRTPHVYAPTERFAVGQAVEHPTFGVGIVLSLPSPQKMEVLFAVGSKVLLHDRGGMSTAPQLARPGTRDASRGPRTPDAPPRKN